MSKPTEHRLKPSHLLRTDKMFINSRVFHFISKTDVSEKNLFKIFQSTADLYILLHILNDSADIVYNNRFFFPKEVVRNVNNKGKMA